MMWPREGRTTDYKYRQWMMIIIFGVVFIKLIVMGLFSSDYQEQMFIPFVNSFLEGHRNPYQYYYENNLLYSFPYPPLMLWIESIGALGLEIFHIGENQFFIRNLVFKLPLLVCDLVSMYYLIKICGKRRKYILVLYFCSPIIFYATFMHGQLDIIPTTFLIVAIYYLLTKKDILFSVALIAALSCKLHILAVVPLVYWYLFKKRGIKKCIASMFGVMAGVLLISVPYFSTGFLKYVMFNREQTALTNVYLDYSNVQLYLPILALAIIYLHLIQVNGINRELFLCSTGIIFAVFLIFVSPMPGWFVWLVPFVLIYFVEVNENRYKVLAQYAIFCILYLIYFGFLHKTKYVDLYMGKESLDWIKYDNAVIRNVVFTVLAATLIMIVGSMYRFGISKNVIYRRNNRAFTIGIAGDSGTGKTELLSHLEALLGVRQILYIEGDGDHRWERGNRNWEQYTHLDPRANYLYRQAQNLAVLKTGNPVKRKDYDHDTGKFTEEHRINPKPYIIMCGLHSLYLPQMRKELDLKIYLDTDEKLRRYWKIARDTDKRGYSAESIIEQIEKRIPDAQKYIYPQKVYADFVIQYFDQTLQDYSDISHKEQLSLMITAKTSFNLEEIVYALRQEGLKIDYSYSGDLQHQVIVIDAESMQKKIDYMKIAKENIEQFDDIFPQNINWKDQAEGMVQLFILVAIGEKIMGD